jgi:hypothetical protein
LGKRSDNLDDVWMAKKHQSSVVVVVRKGTKRFGAHCDVWVQFARRFSSDGHDR